MFHGASYRVVLLVSQVTAISLYPYFLSVETQHLRFYQCSNIHAYKIIPLIIN